MKTSKRENKEGETIDAAGLVLSILSQRAGQRRSEIHIDCQEFKSSYDHLNGGSTLEITRLALARALMTAGYRERFDEQGVTDIWHLIAQYALCMGNTVVDRNGNLGPSKTFRNLSPSGKANVAEELGVALTVLCAQELLDVTWVRSVNREDWERAEGKKKLEAKHELGVKGKGSPREPDYVGFDKNERSHVLEAKGYSSGYDRRAHQHAIDQVSQVERIDGKTPATRVACFHDLAKSPFRSVLIDPEQAFSPLGLNLRFDRFIRSYYKPFVEDAIWRSAPIATWGARSYRLWLLPLDICFGIDDEILSRLWSGEIPREAFDWYARLDATRMIGELEIGVEGSVGRDGIVLRQGSRGSSQWVRRKLSLGISGTTSLLADLRRSRTSCLSGAHDSQIHAELEMKKEEDQRLKDELLTIAKIAVHLVSAIHSVIEPSVAQRNIALLAEHLTRHIAKALPEYSGEVLSVTFYGSALDPLRVARDIDCLVETAYGNYKHLVLGAVDLCFYSISALERQADESSLFLMSLQRSPIHTIVLPRDKLRRSMERYDRSRLQGFLKGLEPRHSYRLERAIATLSGWLLFAKDGHCCDANLALGTLVWSARTLAIAVALEQDRRIASLSPTCLETALKFGGLAALLRLRSLTDRILPHHLDLVGRFLTTFGGPQPTQWIGKTLREIEQDLGRSLRELKEANDPSKDNLACVHARAKLLSESRC